jgi:hypothetical protein
MPKKRYVFIKSALGVVIIDRRAHTWTLTSGKCVIDYGTCRGRPDYLHYLPGRAVERKKVEI